MPPCCQCEGMGVICYGKTCGPRCWRCSQQKIGCSMVEARKKKGKEMEVIKVKRSRKGNRVEMGETDRWMEAMEAMVTEMRRIVDGVEALVAGQQDDRRAAVIYPPPHILIRLNQTQSDSIRMWSESDQV